MTVRPSDPGVMQGLWAPDALLPTGWRSDVAFYWNDAGFLTGLETDVPNPGLPEAMGAVLPGMPNLHSHAFQRLLTGRVQRPQDGGDFWTWRETMYEAASRLDPATLEAVCAWAFSEMLSSGYTSVVEFHYVHRVGGRPPLEAARAVLNAADRVGIRLTLAPVVYRRGGLGNGVLTDRQHMFALDGDALSELMHMIRDSDAAVAIAPHSLRAANLSDIEEALSLISDSEPVHIHVSEQPAEVEAARRHLGTTPIAWLDREFRLSPRWCLVHATHASAEELEMLESRSATLALCPTTEHDLGDGRFPLEQTPSARWGIGSDSHIQLCPEAELRLILQGLRAARGLRGVLPDTAYSAGTALWLRAASDGIHATGTDAGRLEVGSPADLLVLDERRALFAGLNADEAASAFVLSGSRGDLAEVRVGGVVVARSGLHEIHDEVAAGWRQAVGQVFHRPGDRVLQGSVNRP